MADFHQQGIITTLHPLFETFDRSMKGRVTRLLVIPFVDALARCDLGQ